MPDYDDEEQYEEQEEQEEQEEEEPQAEETQEHTWQYSTCGGNKKAFLVGVNYPGSSAPLNGCINDVQNIKEFLLSRGYEEENMRILTDDQEDEELIPTKANMLDGMRWLVEDAAPNDSLFFHFSGHGVPVKDEDGDEEDGNDEAICPSDHEEEGNIVDDTMHDILVSPLPVGCRLTVIFDCCHSGSGIDLPYTYRDTGAIREPSKEEQLEALKHHAMRGDTDALTGQVEALKLVESGEAAKAAELTKATKHSDADVIFFSGCLDAQTSADATIRDKATGALSHAFREVLNENPNPSYKELLVGIRAIISQSYDQIPQLSSSHPYDIDLEFVI